MMNRLPVVKPLLSQRPSQLGRTGVAALIAVFVAGAIAATLWSSYRGRQKEPTGPAPIVLSEGTKDVLRQLDAPVEIRFYWRLDPSSVPDTARAFARRADQLLDAYESEGGGKIKISHINDPSSFNADAAVADGIKPFNLSQGDACFLGVALIGKTRGEVLPRLAPEWEPALESDLTRALARLIEPVSKAPAAAQPIDNSAVEAVKRIIPDPAAVALENGKQTIRDASLAEFAQAAKDFEARLQEAQQAVLQAPNDAARQAATKDLQALRAEQMDTLNEIAAKAKARTEAFERIKSEGK